MTPAQGPYDLPHLEKDAALTRFFPAAERRHQVETYRPLEDLSKAFAPAFFDLSQVTLFQEACSDSQARILARCNRQILEEACFVEKAGVAYAARMVLEAKSIEERILYGWIAAEESDHLRGITSLLGDRTPVGTQDEFLGFLEQVISGSPREVLLFVVQVILEGWGLHHYKTLSKASLDPQLKKYFQRILSDEARHHGSGEVLFEDLELGEAQAQRVVEAMETFLNMVRVGPLRVLGNLEVELKLSPQQRRDCFEELQGYEHAQSRLQRLRSLMKGPNAVRIRDQLQDRGFFEPFDPEQVLSLGETP